jgi:DNA-binding transcriptional MerR regulator
MQALKIGELAREAGVSVDTIRFYERRGLLPRPDRRPSGYRIYSAATAERIRMAKFLQTLGFSLDEIALSLGQIDAGMMSKRHGQAKLTAVLDRVEGRIDDLKRVRNTIRKVIADCQAGKCEWDTSCNGT